MNGRGGGSESGGGAVHDASSCLPNSLIGRLTPHPPSVSTEGGKKEKVPAMVADVPTNRRTNERTARWTDVMRANNKNPNSKPIYCCCTAPYNTVNSAPAHYIPASPSPASRHRHHPSAQMAIPYQSPSPSPICAPSPREGTIVSRHILSHIRPFSFRTRDNYTVHRERTTDSN